MKRKPIEVEFLPEGVSAGEGLKMTINLDLLTLEKMDELDREFVKTMKMAQEARDAENGAESASMESLSPFLFDKANVKFKARSLAGAAGEDDPEIRLIREWNMTDENDNPTPVSYDFLVNMPKKILDDLYKFVTSEAAEPTKKTAKQ